MRYCSLACRTLSFVVEFSNGVTERSLMVCSGPQQCSGTPDSSTFSLIMSHLCSLRTLGELQSSLCFMSWFLSVLVKLKVVCDVLT